MICPRNDEKEKHIQISEVIASQKAWRQHLWERGCVLPDLI